MLRYAEFYLTALRYAVYLCATQMRNRSTSTESVSVLAWKSGFRGASGLARHLGLHRTTVHRAMKNPKRFSNAYARIVEALEEGLNE